MKVNVECCHRDGHDVGNGNAGVTEVLCQAQRTKAVKNRQNY